MAFIACCTIDLQKKSTSLNPTYVYSYTCMLLRSLVKFIISMRCQALWGEPECASIRSYIRTCCSLRGIRHHWLSSVYSGVSMHCT